VFFLYKITLVVHWSTRYCRVWLSIRKIIFVFLKSSIYHWRIAQGFPVLWHFLYSHRSVVWHGNNSEISNGEMWFVLWVISLLRRGNGHKIPHRDYFSMIFRSIQVKWKKKSSNHLKINVMSNFLWSRTESNRLRLNVGVFVCERSMK